MGEINGEDEVLEGKGRKGTDRLVGLLRLSTLYAWFSLMLTPLLLFESSSIYFLKFWYLFSPRKLVIFRFQKTFVLINFIKRNLIYKYKNIFAKSQTFSYNVYYNL